MSIRTFAFIGAIAFGVATAVVAGTLGSPLAAWGCGVVGGAVVVLANVLTHPLIFGWRK
jgi:hypothetical protein